MEVRVSELEGRGAPALLEFRGGRTSTRGAGLEVAAQGVLIRAPEKLLQICPPSDDGLVGQFEATHRVRGGDQIGPSAGSPRAAGLGRGDLPPRQAAFLERVRGRERAATRGRPRGMAPIREHRAPREAGWRCPAVPPPRRAGGGGGRAGGLRRLVPGAARGAEWRGTPAEPTAAVVVRDVSVTGGRSRRRKLARGRDVSRSRGRAPRAPPARAPRPICPKRGGSRALRGDSVPGRVVAGGEGPRGRPRPAHAPCGKGISHKSQAILSNPGSRELIKDPEEGAGVGGGVAGHCTIAPP
mmetsp:Transcript_25009/g.79248  ORF Transcript_25009/g.79248 Transcript_25009/m.79248 type:complete len:298 (-) Transcript_25009:113-1006(-)